MTTAGARGPDTAHGFSGRARPRLGARVGVGGRHAAGGPIGRGPAWGTRRPPARRTLRLVQGLLVLVSLVVLGPGLVGGSTPAASAAAPSCPGGANQCVVASPSQCTSSCPSVDVGPTEDLADDAFVYVSMSNFPAGDWVAIDFCPASQSGSSDPICAYSPAGFEGITFVPAKVKLLANGSSQLSYQVTSDLPNQGNQAIPGEDVEENDRTAPIYCDNTTDPCDLQITDMGQATDGGVPPFPAITGVNTIVVPLTFQTGSAGCPGTDPIINTEGSFSIEQFLPAAVAATCQNPSNGVIGLNISTDSESAVTDFSQGTVSLAFTDDPNDPAEQSALQGQQYMFIPVAASASVVSFLSATSSNAHASPESTYDLTPNMVAGMLTAAYGGAFGSDVLVPPLTCKELGCNKGSEGGESSFNLLNPPPTGAQGPQQLLASYSSVAMGTSDELTSWMCDMPNTAFEVELPDGTEVPVTDRNTAANTLATNVTGLNPWPFPSCTSYPVIPTLGTQVPTYAPAQTPANQAVQIRKEWAGGTIGPSPGLYGPNTAAGFGGMDWGDAAYLGLDTASLQNAAGDFVAPSQASVDAALDDATTLSNGTLAYDYTTADPNAYPTPMVTYAVLSLAPQPGNQVVNETDLLTNVVEFSHQPTGEPLPAGYVPLPDDLYAQATTDIQTALKDIVETSPPTPRNPGTTTPSTPTPSPGSPTPTAPEGTPTAPSGTLTTTSLNAGVVSAYAHVLQPTTSAASSSTTPPKSPKVSGPKPAGAFVPRIVALLTGRDRWILPLLLGALVLSLPSGFVTVLASRLRRRRPRRARTATGPTG